MEYEWINSAKLSDDFTSITFNNDFNEVIRSDTLPKNVTSLIFGHNFNQKIEPKI